MSASAAEYEKMFGSICENSQPMARCNCTACNNADTFFLYDNELFQKAVRHAAARCLPSA